MKRLAALLVLAFASTALVACGGSDSTTTTSSSGEAAGISNEEAVGNTGDPADYIAKLEADPNGKLAYTTNKATVKAGNVTLYLWNPQSVPHNVALEDSKGKYIAKTETVHNTGTNITIHGLKPGTYTFYCAVPGHRKAGMEGTLIVE